MKKNGAFVLENYFSEKGNLTSKGYEKHKGLALDLHLYPFNVYISTKEHKLPYRRHNKK